MSIKRIAAVCLLGTLGLVSTVGTTSATLNTITTLSAYAQDSALVLDSSGNPVIAYRDSLDLKLRVMHCDDPFCVGGGDTVATPDVESGQYSSVALDASGNPAVSYYTTPFDYVKLLHCDDPNCAGVEPVTTPDPDTYLLDKSTSIALDASGNPVIAYAPWSPHFEIRIMHCNDPACTGDDESITIHDSLAAAPSMVLDASGNPVVAYYRSSSQVFTTGTLRVMHCNDPDCAGNDDSVTSPEPATGITPSVQLDTNGYPVIAYYTGTSSRDLKVMHCNDANCTGTDESISSPDTAGDVGSQPSLALHGNLPAVSYRDEDNNDLKLLRCNDPNCAFPGDTIASIETDLDSGDNSSLVIDGSGLPAITYDAGPDLHLIRCGDPDCAETVGGIAKLPVLDASTSNSHLIIWVAIALGTVLGVGLVTLQRRKMDPNR